MSTFLSANNQHEMVIPLFVHMSGNNQSIYGHALVMLGSLCTVYTNTFTRGQLKLRLVDVGGYAYISFIGVCL